MTCASGIDRGRQQCRCWVLAGYPLIWLIRSEKHQAVVSNVCTIEPVGGVPANFARVKGRVKLGMSGGKEGVALSKQSEIGC